MCGIIGLFPIPLPTVDAQFEAMREAAIRFLTTSILIRSVDRGGDATGIAVLLRNGEWLLIKQPVKADEFSLNSGQLKYTDQDPDANFKSWMGRWRKAAEQLAPTSCVIGHVRKETKGSEFNPDNNHPIAIGNVIGVHNGKVSNDDKIFETYKENIKRVGQVDSEAIFQVQHMVAPEAAPDKDVLAKMDSILEGEYATLSFNIKVPGVIGGLRRLRPMEVLFIPDYNLIVVASEKRFIDGAVDDFNRFTYSLTGGTLKSISTDTKSIFIPDDSLVVFDVRAPKKFEDCVFKADIKRKPVTSGTSYTTGSGYNTPVNPYSANNSSYPGYTPPAPTTKATVEDFTEYTSESSKEYYSGNPAIEIYRKGLQMSLKAREATRNSSLYKEGLEVLSKRIIEKIGWLSSVDETLIMTMFEEDDWMAGTDDGTLNCSAKDLEGYKSDLSENPLFVPAILHAIGIAYNNGFPEGYHSGYSTAEGEVGETNKEATERWPNQDVKKKVSAMITNMKTALLAALTSGRLVEVTNGVVVVDRDFVSVAEKINPDFDLNGLLGLLSTSRTKKIIDAISIEIERSEVDEEEDK